MRFFCVTLLLLFVSPMFIGLRAQDGCPSVTISSEGIQQQTTVDCDDPCALLETEVFETGSTDSYDVTSIPFDPPYAFGAGTSLFINIDDTWSDLIPLPFEFCFFDNNYSNIVVGSNGVITFDAGEAGGFCPYAFDESAPDPGLPTNAIFGAYHDIDPSDCGAVRYAIIGEAPCRTFVVNYDEVCHFGGACNGLTTSSQVVFYETTNTIDIYIQDKPACTGWNDGNALVGIQNIAGTVAYVPPGTNTGPWSSSNEAWRFTPNGGAPTFEVTWFEGGQEIATGNTLEVCPTTDTDYIAQVVYNDCGGNSIIVEDTFTVLSDLTGDNPEPTINTSGAFCEEDGFIAAEALNPGGVWSSDCGGCIDPITGLIDLTQATPGPLAVTYTVTGDCGDISETVILDVIPFVEADIFALQDVCESAAPFEVQVSELGGTFTSDCVGCIDPVTGIFDPAVAGAGVYNITYTTGDVCPNVDQDQITIVSQDIADFVIPTQICENSPPIDLIPTQFGGDWSSDCGNCTSILGGSFDPSQSGEGFFSVTYEFDSFCPDIVTQQIEVINVDAPEITPVDPICTSLAPIEVEADVPDGVWSADCGGCIDPFSGTFDPGIGAGNYEVTYTVGQECPVSDMETVEVLPQLSAAIIPIDSLCTDGIPVDLTPVDAGGTWSSDCLGCIDIDSGIFDPSAAAPGTYEVTYTIDGACGDQSTLEVIVDMQDDAAIIQPETYCFGWGDVQLESAQAGGNWSATCDDCIDSETGIINTQLAGEGIHTVTYSFSGICGDAQQINFQVIPNDDSTIDESYGFCIDEPSQQLFAATEGGFWTASCESCITAQGLFSPGLAGIGEHTVSYTIPGPCGSESSESLFVFGLPQPSFSVSDYQGCVPLQVLFTVDSLQNASSQWSFGDGTFSVESGSVTHTYYNSGCYDAALTLTSFEGCENTIQYNDLVCSFPNPVSDFTYTPAFPTTDSPVIELEETAEGEISYQWISNDALISSDPELTINLVNEGAETYTVCLEVIDGNGCTDLECKDIELLESLRVFIPNIFTPDGDGVNEVWFPVVLGVEEYDLKVFSRWGEVVFASTTPGEPWLGEFQKSSHFCPDGVYSYYLKLVSEENEVKEYTGQVSILR